MMRCSLLFVAVISSIGPAFANNTQQSLAAAGDFEIAWNSPWPSSCKTKVKTDALTRFGIQTNAANAFNGRTITTFYNNPGRMTLGRWPCFYKNGTSLNGGLPQLGNLTAHLAQVRLDVARLLPEDFSGLAVIDWEVWKPWLDEGDRSVYFNKSLELTHGDVASAIAAFNTSSLEFMVQTLQAAKEVRPNGRWGYFGVVGCTFDVDTEACRPEFQRRNDALHALWGAGSALYPELYATCRFQTTAKEPTCDPQAKVTKKIEARLQEAMRVVSSLPGKPCGGIYMVSGPTWLIVERVKPHTTLISVYHVLMPTKLLYLRTISLLLLKSCWG